MTYEINISSTVRGQGKTTCAIELLLQSGVARPGQRALYRGVGLRKIVVKYEAFRNAERLGKECGWDQPIPGVLTLMHKNGSTIDFEERAGARYDFIVNDMNAVSEALKESE